VTYPAISRELDRAGLSVMPFRVLAHLARCADGRTDATVTLSEAAAACSMDAPKARHGLRELSAAGLVRVRWDGDAAHVTFTGPMLAEGGQSALVVPPWVDDAGLSPAALRVLFHHIRRARENRVESRRVKASELCGLSRRGVGMAERELIALGWLEPRGNGGVFVVTLPEPTAMAARGAGLEVRM
jgi:hypothetical protein